MATLTPAAFDGIVRRVRENGSSHIEPAFDETWDDLTKLRWEAAVTEEDTALRVRISSGGLRVKRRRRWVDVPDSYSIQVGASSVGSFTFDSAWTFLIGVSVGAQQVRSEGA